MCLASTSVMMPSSRAKAATLGSTKKVWATGAGSAIPVVSITIPSNFKVPACTRFASLSNTTTRSWRTVQQMQPFIISMISSSACIRVFFFSKSSSIPTSPNSFSITANFLPCCCVRMWFSNVVLPEPRKPVSTCAKSEWPQNPKRNHPRHLLLETTRVDGVKVSLHNGTPRQHRHGHLVGLVHRGHVAACVCLRFLAVLGCARRTGASFGGLSRRMSSGPVRYPPIGRLRQWSQSVVSRKCLAVRSGNHRFRIDAASDASFLAVV